MAYSEEKKQEVLRLLATEAGNNTTRCAQLTGISKTTILNWEKKQKSQSPANTPLRENPDNTPPQRISPAPLSQTPNTSLQETASPFPPATPVSPKQNNPDSETVTGIQHLQSSLSGKKNPQETPHPVPTSHPLTPNFQMNSALTTGNAFPAPSVHPNSEILPETPPATGNTPLILHRNQSVSPENFPDFPLPTPSSATTETSETPDSPEAAPIPTPAELKRRIIRRVSQLIDTCTDPKKLMDTHEALSKSERDSAPPTQESLFDLLSRQLLEKNKAT